jgi:hypothetical protein
MTWLPLPSIDDKLIVRGEPSSFFGLLLKGSLSSVTEDKAQHAIKRGEFFGEGGYFEHSARIADVIASSSATVAVLAYDDLHVINQSLPDLHAKLTTLLSVTTIRRLKRPPFTPTMTSTAASPSTSGMAVSTSASTASLLPPPANDTTSAPQSPKSPAAISDNDDTTSIRAPSPGGLTHMSSPPASNTMLPSLAEVASEVGTESSTATTNPSSETLPSENDGPQLDRADTERVPSRVARPSSSTAAQIVAANAIATNHTGTSSSRGPPVRLHARQRSASAMNLNSPNYGHRTAFSVGGSETDRSHHQLSITAEGSSPRDNGNDDTSSVTSGTRSLGSGSLARSPSRVINTARTESLFRLRRKRAPLAANIVTGATARTRTSQMSMDVSSSSSAGSSLFFAALAEQAAAAANGGGHHDMPPTPITTAPTPSSVRNYNSNSGGNGIGRIGSFDPGPTSLATPTTSRGGSLNMGVRREPSSTSGNGNQAAPIPIAQHERSTLQHLVNSLKAKLANAEEVSEERKNEVSRLKLDVDRLNIALTTEKRAHANSQAETAGLFDMLRDERNAKTGLESDVMGLRVTMTVPHYPFSPSFSSLWSNCLVCVGDA